MPNTKSHPLPFVLQMRLLKTSNHYKSQCNFCFHWQQSASATSGFLSSAGVYTQWNPDRCHPTFPFLQTVFQQIKETKHKTAGQVLITWDILKEVVPSSYPRRSCDCALLGDTALLKSCRSSLAEVSTLLPAHMCEQEWAKRQLGSPAHSGYITLIPADHNKPPCESHYWQAPLTLSSSGKQGLPRYSQPQSASATWKGSSFPLNLLKHHRQGEKQANMFHH